MCQNNKLLVVLTILTTLLTLSVIYLLVTVWQLQSVLDQVQSQLKEKDRNDLKQRDRVQNQLTKLHHELNRVSGDLSKLGTKYDVLYKMVIADKEETRQIVRKMFSNQIDLINSVIATKKEHEANISMLANTIDENHIKVNQSMTGLVELFVREISECKDIYSTILQRLKELESREPVMIENRVVVEREYHVQRVVPQQTWGERIGSYIGGKVQEGLSSLARKAIALFS